MDDAELISDIDRKELERQVAMTLRRSKALPDQPFPIDAARRLAGEVVDGMIARQFWVRRRVKPALTVDQPYTLPIPEMTGSYDYHVAIRLFWRFSRDQLAEAAGAVDIGEAARTHNWPPAYNVSACSLVPVVRYDPRVRRRQLDMLRWGVTPSWLTADAHPERRIAIRGDYVMDDAPWRPALRYRRCLIVIEGYIEWRTASMMYQPYAIARTDGRPMIVAALWDAWRGTDDTWLRSVVIVTAVGNKTIQCLGHRMPLILEPADVPLWLGESPMDDYRVKLLMTGQVGDVLRIWPVSTAINSVEVDEPTCLEPIDL